MTDVAGRDSHQNPNVYSNDDAASEAAAEREVARTIEQLCRRLEDAWQSGNRSQLQSLVDSVDEHLRPHALHELVATEVELRVQTGETPQLSDYFQLFPDSEGMIRAAFADAIGSRTPTHPERFGDFRIVREIGCGGMGIVYEAMQESLGRRVAVKTLLRWSYISRSSVLAAIVSITELAC